MVLGQKLTQPARPEGAEALSPGQRPGLLRMIAYRPVREKALKYKKLTQPARLKGQMLLVNP